jgi:exodeoxyribonuclease VII large subunit
VLPARSELVASIQAHLRSLRQALADVVPQYAQRVDDLTAALTRGLGHRLDRATRGLDGLCEALYRAPVSRLRTEEVRLDGLLQQLNALSPLAVLRRGYSLTTDAEGSVVRRSRDVRPGDRLTTRLDEGRLTSEVLDVHD